MLKKLQAKLTGSPKKKTVDTLGNPRMATHSIIRTDVDGKRHEYRFGSTGYGKGYKPEDGHKPDTVVEGSLMVTKLTSDEILKSLGFNIPDGGVEINGNDAFLHHRVLELIGQTMRVSAIEEGELSDLHGSLAGLVSAWTGEPTEIGHTDKARLRALILIILNEKYGLNRVGEDAEE